MATLHKFLSVVSLAIRGAHIHTGTRHTLNGLAKLLPPVCFDTIRSGGIGAAVFGAFTLLCGLPGFIVTALGVIGKGPGALAAGGPCFTRERCCSGLGLHIACIVLSTLTIVTWSVCFAIGTSGADDYTSGVSIFFCEIG